MYHNASAGKSGLPDAYHLCHEELQEYVGSRLIMRVMLCEDQNGIARARREAESLQLSTFRK